MRGMAKSVAERRVPAKCYFAPLRRLQSLQSIWQLAGTVRPFAVPRSDVIRLHLRKRP